MSKYDIIAIYTNLCYNRSMSTSETNKNNIYYSGDTQRDIGSVHWGGGMELQSDLAEAIKIVEILAYSVERAADHPRVIYPEPKTE